MKMAVTGARSAFVHLPIDSCTRLAWLIVCGYISPGKSVASGYAVQQLLLPTALGISDQQLWQW
jgi:hypothetical protein